MCKCQNTQRSKYQNANMPKCKNVQMSKYQNAKMPKYQNDKVPKWQSAKMPKCQNATLLCLTEKWQHTTQAGEVHWKPWALFHSVHGTCCRTRIRFMLTEAIGVHQRRRKNTCDTRPLWRTWYRVHGWKVSQCEYMYVLRLCVVNGRGCW